MSRGRAGSLPEYDGADGRDRVRRVAALARRPVWFSDWGANQVIALHPEGRSEVIVSVPSFPMCIDFLPDGQLLVVDSARRRLRRREPDGSMVTHADLAPLLLKPWNEAVVDADGNAYVNNTGYDFPGGEPALGSVVLVTADGDAARSPGTSRSRTGWRSPPTAARSSSRSRTPTG